MMESEVLGELVDLLSESDGVGIGEWKWLCHIACSLDVSLSYRLIWSLFVVSQMALDISVRPLLFRTVKLIRRMGVYKDAWIADEAFVSITVVLKADSEFVRCLAPKPDERTILTFMASISLFPSGFN